MAVPNDQNRLLLPEGAARLLGDLIHQRLGLLFEPERLDTLVERISPLAQQRGCYSLLDYYYILKYEEDGLNDWFQVMDALSVQETYFWREMAQVHVLVDVLVPKWFEGISRPLRIWCAASASGEEPYTIVMALLESGWGHHPIEIYASDASPAAIDKARKGLYREKSFRALPLPLRDKYFASAGAEWEISSEVKRRVIFQRANLLATDEISSLARAHAIFCRNVFIYFSPHTIRQTLAAFASRMPVNGHLFVGAAESLLRLTTDFELREIAGAFVYVKV